MDLTPEERCERVRTALAEGGCPGAYVEADESGRIRIRDDGQPASVVWRAFAVAGLADECWACWLASPHDRTLRPDCDHDPMTSPWPAVA